MDLNAIKGRIYKIIYKPYTRFHDWKSGGNLHRYVKKIAGQDTNRKIKVAFLVQMSQVWDKQQPVYEAMASDDRFDVDLLVVPEFDFEAFELKSYGEDLQFFMGKYPNANIKMAGKGKHCIDLAKRHYDYVFYERPYNHYLPKKLRSGYVGKFSKICYIPYTSPDLSELGMASYKNFYKDVYFGFMNSEDRRTRLMNSYTARQLKNHHFVDLGYPVLDMCRELPSLEHDKMTVMWAPRWAFTSSIGGSHFMDYKDDFLSFAKEHEAVKILNRPHPLMFSNILKTGIMTEEEVNAYKQACSDADIEFDSNRIIEDSFQKTDVLVSDLSSILWLCFYMEKPIIYCPSDDLELSEELKEMLQYMYIANNWEELSSTLDMLVNGEDPMKEARLGYLDKQKEKYQNSVDNIVECIYEDFVGNGSDRND